MSSRTMSLARLQIYDKVGDSTMWQLQLLTLIVTVIWITLILSLDSLSASSFVLSNPFFYTEVSLIF